MKEVSHNRANIAYYQTHEMFRIDKSMETKSKVMVIMDSPKFLCWNPNCQCGYIRRRDSKEGQNKVLKVWPWSFRIWVLTRRDTRVLYTLSPHSHTAERMWEDTDKRTHLKDRKRVLTGNWIVWNLDLGLLVSGTVRNYISVGLAIQSMVFYYGSLNTLTQILVLRSGILL